MGTVGGGTGTWDQTAARWSTSATGSVFQSWNNAAAPTDDAWFANTAGVVTLGEPITVRSINVRTNGYTLSGDVLTLAGGTGQINVGTASSVRLTVDAVVAGATGLNKAGSGSLILNAANTYTGTTTISAGTLALGSAGTISAGGLTLAGGVLSLSGDFTRALGAGAGQVRFTSNGGFAAYGGAANITGFGGVPEWGSTANFLANGRSLIFGSTVADNVVTWTNDFSLGAANRTITANDNSGSAADRAVISGVISSSGGGLVKNGSGRLDLTGANTYTGATALQSGSTGVTTLANVGASASSLGAPTTVAAGTIALGRSNSTGTLLYLGGGSTTDRVLNLAGTTGGGVLQNNGSGALVFTSGVTATGAGSKTLTLSGTETGANEIQGVIANNSATHRTAVTKSGTGTWELSGANTYSGNTTLSAGTLVAGNNTAFGTGTLVLSGGGAVLRGDGTPRTLANAITLSNSVTLGGASDLTFTGSLNQTGNRTLTVTNTGVTTLAGNVVLAENNQTRTLTVAPAAGASVVVSGVVQNGTGSGADRLTKTGAGALTLAGANTYTGTTTLSAGTLVAANDAAFGTGALVLSGAGAVLRGDGPPRTLANAVTLSNNVTFGGASDLTFTGALNQTGSRTLTVTNTGVTTVAGNVVLAENNQTRTLTVASAAAANVVFSGSVQNGTGTGADSLVKSGAGTLTLSGATANTFTGDLVVADGLLRAQKTAGINIAGSGVVRIGDGSGAAASATLQLAASNQLPDSADLVFRADGLFDLAGFSETVDEIDSFAAGQGRIQIGAGQLTVGAGGGDSVYSGLFSADPSGVLEKVGAGTLTLSDPDAARADRVMDFGGELRVDAGGLTLDNLTLNVETLRLTGTSVLDFGGSSILNVNQLVLELDGGETTTINNWAQFMDTFYAQTVLDGPGGPVAPFDLRGAPPLNRIVFASFSGSDTWWQSSDSTINPVPEPAAHGLVFSAGLGAWLALRRRRRHEATTRS